MSTPQSAQKHFVDHYPARPEALVGRTLDDRYLITDVLGSGGMGTVLAARHRFLKRRVAVKLLHPELLMVSEVRQRFLREAEAASVVRHPCVVAVTDFGVTAKGMYYLVMEHLEGAELLDLLESRGPLDLETIVRLADQISGALDAIHAAGFVHRDLKPENLWVTNPEAPTTQWRVKVIDFGIAGLAQSASPPDSERLTQTGAALGTAYYMSPEQVRGEAIDGRSDIYALGCVMFELATGSPAFDAASAMEVMFKHMEEPTPDLAMQGFDGPSWFSSAVQRCMAKSPDDRFATGAELSQALASRATRVAENPDTVVHAITLQQSTEERSHSGPPPLRTPKGRHARPLGMFALALCLVGGLSLTLALGAAPKRLLSAEASWTPLPMEAADAETAIDTSDYVRNAIQRRLHSRVRADRAKTASSHNAPEPVEPSSPLPSEPELQRTFDDAPASSMRPSPVSAPASRSRRKARHTKLSSRTVGRSPERSDTSRKTTATSTTPASDPRSDRLTHRAAKKRPIVLMKPGSQ